MPIKISGLISRLEKPVYEFHGSWGKRIKIDQKSKVTKMANNIRWQRSF